MNSSIQKMIKRIQQEHNILLTDTFLDTMEDPIPILRSMASTAMNWMDPTFNVWEIGKQWQREYPGKIPFKTELEISAGLWYLIYNKKI